VGAQGGYVEKAFRFADAANSQKLKLFYNDYAAEAAGGPKSEKVYGMLQDMKGRGVPITGVGLQMHVSVDAYPNPWLVADNIKRLGELGMEVHITCVIIIIGQLPCKAEVFLNIITHHTTHREMDVRCAGCDSSRLDLQASIYGHMLEACLNNSGVCKSFEMWGFTDKHTWLSDFNNPTHADMAPLPFDLGYNKKPAYFELLTVLSS